MSNKQIYMHISAGRGPAECCWLVAQVLEVIVAECQRLNLETKIIEKQKGPEEDTFYSILLEVSGKKSRDKLHSWIGTIQWIGKSPFRKYHKRKNWFIGVHLMDKPKPVQLRLDELAFTTFRASGPGGQHRNKVETAVRVKHKATGWIVEASEHRSQHQNKQAVLKKLAEKFEQQSLLDQKKQVEDQWKQHLSLERGNPVKVFEGKKFKLRL